MLWFFSAIVSLIVLNEDVFVALRHSSAFFCTFRSGDVGDALVCSDTEFAYVLLGLIADICF